MFSRANQIKRRLKADVKKSAITYNQSKPEPVLNSYQPFGLCTSNRTINLFKLFCFWFASEWDESKSSQNKNKTTGVMQSKCSSFSIVVVCSFSFSLQNKKMRYKTPKRPWKALKILGREHEQNEEEKIMLKFSAHKTQRASFVEIIFGTACVWFAGGFMTTDWNFLHSRIIQTFQFEKFCSGNESGENFLKSINETCQNELKFWEGNFSSQISQ